MTQPTDIDAIRACHANIEKQFPVILHELPERVLEDIPAALRAEHEMVIALLAEVDRLREQTRWIPVGEPPKSSGVYLTTRVPGSNGGEDRVTRFFDGFRWFGLSSRLHEYPTHWMPLPTPPEAGDV